MRGVCRFMAAHRNVKSGVTRWRTESLDSTALASVVLREPANRIDALCRIGQDDFSVPQF
jgi:hypothetical protein